MNRAVFLDRDGTLIEEKEYLHRPEDVVIFPGVGPALKRLEDAGFMLFVVTNQSGVGRGYFPLEDVHRVHEHLSRELAKHNVRIEKFYIAPEHPDAPSRGRKPSPQFLFDARDEFGIDLTQSYIIGDKLIDLECGWNAGVKQSVLVRTGYGAELEKESPDMLTRADVYCNVSQAARSIFDESASRHRDRLRAARKTKGISEHDLATQLGQSSGWYYDIEAFPHDLFMACTLKEISELCKILNLPARNLFQDHAHDLNAPAITIAHLLNRIVEQCRLEGISISEFEGQVGWRLSEYVGNPNQASEEWCVDCLRDVCEGLGIDWFQVLAGL